MKKSTELCFYNMLLIIYFFLIDAVLLYRIDEKIHNAMKKLYW